MRISRNHSWRHKYCGIIVRHYNERCFFVGKTDSFVCFVEDGEEEKKLEYNPSALLATDLIHGERVAVLLSSGYVDEENHRVYVWDDDGDEILSSSPYAFQHLP